jgi:hypothetical protein
MGTGGSNPYLDPPNPFIKSQCQSNCQKGYKENIDEAWDILMDNEQNGCRSATRRNRQFCEDLMGPVWLIVNEQAKGERTQCFSGC